MITDVDWLDGFEIVLISNRWPPRHAQLGVPHSGRITKLLFHTTEGSTIDSALAAYRARAGRFRGGVHPHITYAPASRDGYQHVPLTMGSYSLKRGDADGVIQVELVGHAGDTPHWSPQMLRNIGTDVVAPIIAAIPTIPLRAAAAFLTPAAGVLARPWPYGVARLSPTQWALASGILGHQHAPFDDHWDPGGLDIDTIIAAAKARLTLNLEDTMFVAIDTTEGTHWLVANGKARILSDPDAWMASWDGPVVRSANMRFVIPDLYAVVT